MRVRLSPRAREDLRGLIRYIAADSPRNARLVRDRIDGAVQQLALHPESGRPGRVEGMRELVILHTSYIAPYRVTNGILEIIAFIRQLPLPQGSGLSLALRSDQLTTPQKGR